MAIRILILSEDDTLRGAAAVPLSAEGCEVFSASRVESALTKLDAGGIDAVVVDRKLCTATGSVLPQISRRSPGATILLLGESPGLASEADDCRAYDVLAVPLRPPEVRLAVRRAEEREALRRQRRLFQRDLARLGDDRPIVASSPAMIRVLEAMERASEYKSPVLLSGERGSGLEVLARAIHAQSARRNHPFVALQCAGRSEDWLAKELLGRLPETPGPREPLRHGLFCEAEGGSLYLGEVSALPPRLQLALLGLLRDEQVYRPGADKPVSVDVRVITSTSRDLSVEAAAGRFAPDLCRLLEAVKLHVPPLRARPTDIPLLVDHYLARARDRHAKPDLDISDDALERLVAYDWPGNVRELSVVLERAAMLATGERLSVRDLPDGLLPRSPANGSGAPGTFALRTARKSLESDMIRQALRVTQGNRTHAARLLEISHRALLYKIKEYDIRD